MALCANIRCYAIKILESCTYLEEGDLVLELRIWTVGSVGHQREVIEEVPTTQVLGGLRDDFAPLHRLVVPRGRSILVQISQQVSAVERANVQ